MLGQRLFERILFGGRRLLGRLVELVHEVVKIVVVALADFDEVRAWHLIDEDVEVELTLAGVVAERAW